LPVDRRRPMLKAAVGVTGFDYISGLLMGEEPSLLKVT
jgi:hypothetical protein